MFSEKVLMHSAEYRVVSSSSKSHALLYFCLERSDEQASGGWPLFASNHMIKGGLDILSPARFPQVPSATLFFGNVSGNGLSKNPHSFRAKVEVIPMHPLVMVLFKAFGDCLELTKTGKF